MNAEWIYFLPDLEIVYKIIAYDDGNQVYEQYVNKWAIYGKWRGKCSLINIVNPSIKITSISKWKITRI